MAPPSMRTVRRPTRGGEEKSGGKEGVRVGFARADQARATPFLQPSGRPPMRIANDAALSSPRPSIPLPTSGDPRPATHLIRAAGVLVSALERGAPLDARTLRDAMTDAFGASDSEGAWVWKDAYEACEAAQL